ncbi:dihydrofolate reductase family protein [Rhodococcus sp. NPDC047139]|uniref:dihydrofolate reductase family protein n=1 Tax=Rhodococcus sp. NPDC047139 TaxID=3155141 RepID=UPI0034007F21
MKLTVTMFVSADGVAQGPGGPEEDRSDGFARGGWVVPLLDEETGRFIDETFSQVDAFLLGRNTYEIFAASWPNSTDPDDPIANALNTLPKHVASTTLTDPKWNNTTVLEGDVPAAVAELKKRPGRELQVHGSIRLVDTLYEHDLVDEYRFMTFPVIVGQGLRLFARGGPDTKLDLVESRITSSGIVITVYRPAGRPDYGVAEVE